MDPTAEWVVAAPAAPLRTFVDAYVGYRTVGVPGGLHRGLPSRHMTFIVSIGDPIDVIAQTDPRQAPSRYRTVVSGLQASPALIRHGGDQEGVALELTPLGSRALLGAPARALWNTSFELGDVVGSVADELWERLQVPAPWADRFAVCDDVLSRLTTDAPPVPALDRAWRVLVGSAGTVAVGDVATEVGWTRQHLTRGFTDELGLGPKTVARVARFERARRLLAGHDGRTVADVAATCGYADQSHLDREFAVFAGCSPTTWLRDEQVPFVQDDELRVG